MSHLSQSPLRRMHARRQLVLAHCAFVTCHLRLADALCICRFIAVTITPSRAPRRKCSLSCLRFIVSTFRHSNCGKTQSSPASSAISFFFHNIRSGPFTCQRSHAMCIDNTANTFVVLLTPCLASICQTTLVINILSSLDGNK